jgi:osmoprotectant transport system permease protein
VSGRIAGTALVAAAVVLSAGARADVESAPQVVVGSKKFTESVILGELAAQLARAAGAEAAHRRELGGTRVLWSALLRGDIDVYPEYTGTIVQEILSGREISDDAALRAALLEGGVVMSRPLGFNNTYAIGMRKAHAAQLGVSRISDLRRHLDLRLGFTSEFMDRGDGWPSLRDAYGLGHRDVRGLDHDLAYRGLASDAIDVMDLYSTDAEIRYYDLQILEDDAHHFPVYDAVWLQRSELAVRAPEVAAALRSVEGRIDEATMSGMNARAKLERVPEGRVAAEFLEERFALSQRANAETRGARLLRNTREHLALVGVSLSAAILLAVPLGVLAAHRARLGQGILGAVGIVQTIPALALLVVLIGPFGIGGPPAIAALFLYSLLPIVRNTYAGLHDIPIQIRESADALGLPASARLRRIELPLAARSILAGVKTSAVINIGTATLGALIGAGGYGQPILTGIRLDDYGLILQGAVPAAGLALAVQGLFELAERWFVPRGLRLARAE